MNHICNCLNGFHLDGGWYPEEVKVNESHFLSWTEPGWPAMLNDISQWPWNERRRWMEMEERKSQPEREKNLLLLSTIASPCDFFFSLRLGCSHFTLALSPILVPILSLAVCQFVKARHHYCQKITLQCQYKSHTHNVTHAATHTLTCHPLMCWKRATFFLWLGSDTQQWACPTGILSETDKQCEPESLIFLSDTFSPQFVSMYIWLCHCHLTVLARGWAHCCNCLLCNTTTVTICASQDIRIAARSQWPLARFIALTFVLKTIMQSGQI